MFYRSIFILTDSSSYNMYNMMWTKPIFFLDWGLYSSSQYRYKIYWRFGIGVFHVQHAIGAYFSWFAPLCPDCLHLSTATTITDDSRSSNLGNSQKVDSGLCCSQQPHVHMSWNNYLAFREREPTQACKLILNVLLVFTDEGFTGKHWSWRFIRWTDIDNG